ncbi:hypothetical protein ACJRO7_031893 [Eucalyptus globulus]|uniref:t-SNARE coiled-coil homology domain-containing protein n=1 Tax=Eucalyptus globulus TaxID=34317 RepID=A0ABD3JLC8_EUCGL
MRIWANTESSSTSLSRLSSKRTSSPFHRSPVSLLHLVRRRRDLPAPPRGSAGAVAVASAVSARDPSRRSGRASLDPDRIRLPPIPRPLSLSLSLFELRSRLDPSSAAREGAKGGKSGCRLKFRSRARAMNYRREPRAAKAALFDGYNGLEEGLRASSSYSHQINEHDNDKAVDSLQDRVIFLKRLTGDIHEEVESHNRFLDQMGNSMDSSRGVMSGTMDRFKRVSRGYIY